LPRLAVLAVIAALGVWLVSRMRGATADTPAQDASATADEPGRRLAAAGN
jgi:hypothetical protein